MSVLKLRRDMVVADDAAPAKGPAKSDVVLEISAPLPLRTIDITPRAAPPEIVEPANDLPRRGKARPRKTFFQKLKGWTIGLGVTAALAAYPVMTVMSSETGDRIGAPIDRTQWTVAWAGAAALTLDKQYTELGWATDAPAWAPMARLTAKPAWQQALAGSLGEYVTLKAEHVSQSGRPDADLSAAGRLLSPNATGIQVRAARDALINYDRRQRRLGAPPEAAAPQIAAELRLIQAWSARSQAEIDVAAARKGNAIDAGATQAVYAAKGRAMAAYAALEYMPTGGKEFEAARTAAMEAWKSAAQFHPILVLNGNPDGSIFGNHPTSMGFAIARADDATDAFLAKVEAAIQPAAAVAPAAASAGPAEASN